MLRAGFAIGAIALLSACNMPRGGPVESEIVAAAKAETPEIALYYVTRDTLNSFQSWPATNSSDKRGWLRHKHAGPDNAIGSGDLIDVVIWDSEEQSLLSSNGNRMTHMKALKVSSAGTIFLPFAGAVRVAGLSEAGARTRIQRKMAEAVPSAQVQMSVTKGPLGSVSVVSGVQKPGAYAIDTTHYTVLNAIATAGGASASIDNPQVRLIRKGKVYRKSMASLLENPDADTVLRGGDKLTVEKDSRYFRSLGAASKEAIFPFTKDSVSALDAMSIIGGVSDQRANPKGIMVLRQYQPGQVRADGAGPSNDRAVFVFDITTADGLFSAGKFGIQSQDTVLVTESSVATANAALLLFARLTGALTDVNNL